MSVGQTFQIDGTGTYTITSIAPVFAGGTDPNTYITFSPAYTGTRPAQLITSPFVTAVVPSGNMYTTSPITINMSTAPRTGNYYQVAAQYVGDNIYAPLITTSQGFRL
jgi:hypothetical protein